ncbi:craniofacial development protein 1 [Bombina bombina]|uniref:craniofacial development protein 1 n=1 Tax=Bombina bombina TaxID=8345 RepID=UPI00235B05C2|nr:craniofacial development protein 1 [Bombina bombina]
MSDYDSEDYSSSEDEDYVPSGGEYSEDDVNDLVKEDDGEEEEEGERTHQESKKKKKMQKCIAARKRKKGGLVLDTEEGGSVNEGEPQNTEEEKLDDFTEEKKKRIEENKKKREDDLWSSFLSDVGQKPKTQSSASSSLQQKSEEQKTSVKPSTQNTETKKQSEPAKVTITKVLDFAGEEVTVKTEVDSSSKEAKAFIKQQQQQLQPPSQTLTGPSLPAASSVKRTAGMSSILGKLGSKKQKMSTLEKSKLDWEAFKEKEGIGEELAIHNRGKDGYIERKAFLERVDYRQFELEREIRIKNMKPS